MADIPIPMFLKLHQAATMTEYALKKRIAYFEGRMALTKDHRDTPQGKRAYTIARNRWREARKMLIRLQATGRIAGWGMVRLPD